MNSILQEDKMVGFSNRSGKENELRIDPLVPTDEEIKINNRARSAKLRIAEKI
jgi:16S rRNA C1402 N4-methylase RsmH